MPSSPALGPASRGKLPGCQKFGSVHSTPSTDYNRLSPTYEERAERLSVLITSCLDNEGIVHAVEVHRSRSACWRWHIDLQNRNVDPLDEVTDLPGVQVISNQLPLLEYVAAYAPGRNRSWPSTLDRKVARLRVDRFGYFSQHFIGRLKAPGSVSQEWCHVSGFPADTCWHSRLGFTSPQRAWTGGGSQVDGFEACPPSVASAAPVTLLWMCWPSCLQAIHFARSTAGTRVLAALHWAPDGFAVRNHRPLLCGSEKEESLDWNDHRLA